MEDKFESGLSSEEDSTCPECHDILINPVLLSCKHSVCRYHILRSGESEKVCPLCRRRSSMNSPPVNLASTFLRARRQTSSQDFSGFETICSAHKGKLKLFCLDDQELLCLVCRDSRKHANHRFCPVDEAAVDKKEILKSELKCLQEEVRKFENFKQSYNKTAEQIKLNAQRTEWEIEDEFNELRRLLRDEEVARIKALKEDEKQKIQVMMEKIEKTNKQLSSLAHTIRDIEEQMNTDDLSFLQNFKSTLQRAEKVWIPEPGPTVLINFQNHLTNLKLSVLKKMQENVGKNMDFQSGGGKSSQISTGQQFWKKPQELPISMPCEVKYASKSSAVVSTKKPVYNRPNFPGKHPSSQLTRTASLSQIYLPATSHKRHTKHEPGNAELQNPKTQFPAVKELVKKMNRIFDKK